MAAPTYRSIYLRRSRSSPAPSPSPASPLRGRLTYLVDLPSLTEALRDVQGTSGFADTGSTGYLAGMIAGEAWLWSVAPATNDALNSGWFDANAFRWSVSKFKVGGRWRLASTVISRQ